MFLKKNNILLVSFLFFLSGFAALAYQIIWTRLLLLTFGNTTYSVVSVLAAFMAGLALGSYVFGYFSKTVKNPLRVFGFIELGVGLMAVLTPFLFSLLNKIYISIATGSTSSSDLLFVKFVATCLVILPVTTLMGGTLPIVLTAFSRETKSVSRLTGLLYGVNTLGSIFGALFTAFIAIELFGLTTTIYLCSLVNLFIFINTRFINSKIIKSKVDFKKASFKRQNTDRTGRNIVIILYGLSGITSMALEVFWTRLLTPSVGTYIYAFSAILATFLVGLTLGSLFYERYLNKFIETFTLLGYAQLTVAISAFFSILVTSSGVLPANAIIQMIAVVFPGTFAMGTILPTITQLSRQYELGSFVGKAVFFNSLGSTIGPVLAGFLLIPYVGSSRSVLLISVVTACFASILFLLQKEKNKGLTKKILPYLAAAFSLVLMLNIISGKDQIFTSRFIKHQKAIHSREQRAFFEDEVATVFAYSSSDYKQRDLIIDGVETTRLVPETKLIAHLPLLVHKNPRDVLIIALGMGTTFRSSLTYPLTSVDVVELVPSVVKTLSLFHADTKKILADSRGKIIVNDGRQYVHITNKKYDVVTIDPPPPVNSAGTTVLYSKEFYQDIKDNLKEGGVVHQWFFFDTTTQEEELKMLIKTFIDEFTYALVFKSPNKLGISIIASDSPISFNENQFAQKINNPKVNADLREWVGTPTTVSEFKDLYLGNKVVVSLYSEDSLTVTDNNPRTEYFLLNRLFYPSPWVNPIEVTSVLNGLAQARLKNL